ncbi:MAG TPA: Uma2 family endonuclease, partial [Planctomycetaceae bacterium]
MSTALLEELIADHVANLVPLTVAQLHEMVQAGILYDGAPIELIDGTLVYKDRSLVGDESMTHNPLHASAVWRLMHLVTKWAEGIGCFVRCQLPVTLSETSEPEPDMAIIKGNPADFIDRHPGPGDIAAVFEVGHSSLRFDRKIKRRLYASAGIPTYWIVDLQTKLIEVHLQPDTAGGTYLDRTEYLPGQSIPL